MILRLFSTLLLLLTLPAMTLQASEQADRQAILVLDASGSMWGQIDGRSKIEIARDVVADMLTEWNPETPLGVIVYGHRTKGDCSDIEMITPVLPPDAAAINKRVQALNPKGKTPISEAVRQAAEALKYVEQRATVILVSDGKETCSADPCKTASELETLGVDFTTHVIGFDVSDAEGLRQLKCIAENSGGSFLTAASAGELKAALNAASEKIEKATVDPDAPGNVRIVVRLIEGGEALSSDDVRIYRETGNSEGNTVREQVERHVLHDKAHVFKLKPGTYIAAASYGDAAGEIPITITPGKGTTAEIILNAGTLNLSAVWHEGGETVSTDDFRIYREQSDANNKTARKLVSRYVLHATERTFTLPAGDYIAAMSRGAATAEAALHITAGETTNTILNLQAGTLTIAPVDGQGKAINLDDYRIYREQQTADGKTVRQQVSRYVLHATSRNFTLSAGDYIAVVSKGAATAESKVQVKAGETTRTAINLNAGWLRITPVDGSGNKLNIDDYRIYRDITDQQGKQSRVLVSRYVLHATSRSFFLPAGDYTVEVSHQGIARSKSVSLQADQTHEVTIALARKHYSGPAGLWQTSEGEMDLQMEGEGFRGRYGSDNGTVLINGAAKAFSGHWIEDHANVTCESEKDGRRYWGRLEIKFNADFNSFSGWWSYCDSDTRSGEWNGSRN